MMMKMLKYCGVLSSDEGQRGLLRICRRPPHPLSHSNSHLRPESCEKKNILPSPMFPIKRPFMTLGMGKEGIGAWITNVDARKAQPYVLWQAHTSLMHICKFSSSNSMLKSCPPTSVCCSLVALPSKVKSTGQRTLVMCTQTSADMSRISWTRPLIFQRLPLPILGLPTAPQLAKF